MKYIIHNETQESVLHDIMTLYNHIHAMILINLDKISRELNTT